MLQTFRKAFQIDDIRKKILYTLAMIFVVRLGSQLPTPGVNPTYIKQFFESVSGDTFNFFNAFTGGSFETMSIFALSITPYITSSIIIQLLTIAIPKLEEMAGEGWRDGKGKRIKNAAEWEQIYRLVHTFPDPHKMTARSEKHSYSTWLQEMMKKDECKRIIGTGLEPETRPESGNNGVPGNVCP